MEQAILSQIDQYAPNTTYDDGVIAGYKAICNITASKIFNSPIGQVELLFMNSDSSGDIGITAALQHPYSHGRIYINSSDPMDYPVIDPNYLSNPAGKLPTTFPKIGKKIIIRIFTNFNRFRHFERGH